MPCRRATAVLYLKHGAASLAYQKNRWPNPRLVPADPPTYTDEFPHGSCIGPTESGDKSQTTGCGWIHVNRESHYIMPGVILDEPGLTSANLSGAEVDAFFFHTNLAGANLSNAKMFNTTLKNSNLKGADLRHAQLGGAVLINTDLRGANLFWAHLDAGTLRQGVKGDSSTICPNGKRWGTAGNDCRF